LIVKEASYGPNGHGTAPKNIYELQDPSTEPEWLSTEDRWLYAQANAMYRIVSSYGMQIRKPYKSAFCVRQQRAAEA